MGTTEPFEADAFLKEIQEMERLLEEFRKAHSSFKEANKPLTTLDLSDLEGSDDEAEGDDLFDVYDSENSFSSVSESPAQRPFGHGPATYDQHWLSSQMEAVALRTGSAMDSSDLYSNVLQLLQSNVSGSIAIFSIWSGSRSSARAYCHV